MPIYTIYEIKPLDKEIEFSYIGSTKNLTHRRSGHKTICNSQVSKGKDIKLYLFIRANGGWDAFNMIPVEEFECDSKTQARIQEQVWINKIENKLNMRKSYRSEEETLEYKKIYHTSHYDDNTQKRVEYKKQYYANNRQKVLEKVKQNSLKNIEKIIEYRKQYNTINKVKLAEENKVYRVNNEEILKTKKKAYYNDNKELLLAKQKIRYEAKKVIKSIECENN